MWTTLLPMRQPRCLFLPSKVAALSHVMNQSEAQLKLDKIMGVCATRGLERSIIPLCNVQMYSSRGNLDMHNKGYYSNENIADAMEKKPNRLSFQEERSMDEQLLTGKQPGLQFKMIICSHRFSSLQRDP